MVVQLRRGNFVLFDAEGSQYSRTFDTEGSAEKGNTRLVTRRLNLSVE